MAVEVLEEEVGGGRLPDWVVGVVGGMAACDY